MVKTKKIIVFFVSIIILTIIGVFFYWKNLQKELISLNENLPEGIKVTKTLMGDYEIVNKIDNYSFGAPKSWEGILEIDHLPEGEEAGYIASSINIEGKTLNCRIVAIDKFQAKSEDDLIVQASNIFDAFGLTYSFIKYRIGDINTVISRENDDLMGMSICFFKKGLFIYSITSCSEEFIEEIIINGKW